MRASLAALLGAAFLGIAAPAFAGEPTEADEPDEADAADVAPAPAQRPDDITIVVPSGSTTTVVTTGGVAAAAPAKAAAAPREDEDRAPPKDEARFRGGVSGLLGVFIPGPILQLGAEGRLGVQIDDLFAIYGDFGAHAGIGWGVHSSETGTDASISGGAAVYVSLMSELTIEDVFFVGAGPTVLYGTFVTLDTNVSSSAIGNTVSAFVGPLPGIKLRTGFGFGSERPSRRKQFTLALECNVLFGQQFAVVDQGGSATVDESTSTGVAVGVLPMLSLGYDAK